MIYYVMGVSGTGKSTIGTLLAEQLDIPFLDGDDFHPASNVEKMSQGIALTDADRLPWLQNIAQVALEHLQSGGAVIACSALKEQYRSILQNGLESEVRWIFLTGDQDLIWERMQKRKGHFMPADLLRSQLDTLESPQNAIQIDVSHAPEVIIQKILLHL